MKPGCQAVNSVEKALLTASATGKDVFVIGGASLYAAAWPYCQRFYLTRIEQSFHGDSQFPDSIPLDQWEIISDERKTYLEHKTGKPVVCRFMQYQQPQPRALPLIDC